MSSKTRGPLVPARPSAHDDEAAAYMPRIPWRYVILAVLSIATVMGGYLLKERRKADELRAGILLVHNDELADARKAYTTLREQIEGMIVSAASKAPDDFVDPRLRFAGLRSGQGLYMRLSLDDAKDPAGIARGALQMEPDAIASCLGLSPTSARGLYEKGQFLMPEFARKTEQMQDGLHLRVQEEVLSQHIRADLPSVLGLLRSDWFMLVLQHGDNRRDAPVDVFLWDLRHGESLLRARVQSRGVLLGARIRSEGSGYQPPGASVDNTAGAANDCSIGAQLKALAGAGLAEVSELPVIQAETNAEGQAETQGETKAEPQTEPDALPSAQPGAAP